MVPNLPARLETYSFGYDRFHKTSGLTRAEQESVLLTINRANAYFYCAPAHSMLADTMSKVPIQATDAVRIGEAIADEKLEALHRFTDVMVVSRAIRAAIWRMLFLVPVTTAHRHLAIIPAIGVKAF